MVHTEGIECKYRSECWHSLRTVFNMSLDRRLAIGDSDWTALFGLLCLDLQVLSPVEVSRLKLQSIDIKHVFSVLCRAHFGLVLVCPALLPHFYLRSFARLDISTCKVMEDHNRSGVEYTVVDVEIALAGLTLSCFSARSAKKQAISVLLGPQL